MSATEDQLNNIELYSGQMFTISDIAIILEMNMQDFRSAIEDPESDIYKAFKRGRLKSEAEIRQAIFDLAKNGSSPAQAVVLDLIEKAKMDDVT